MSARPDLERPGAGGAGALASMLAATAVIIPARNEAGSIGLVLDDLPVVGLVIVVDNGSSDGTAAVAAARGAEVVDEPLAGYGRACLAGMHALRRLQRRRTSASHQGSPQAAIRYVAFLDGDYSDYPERLPELVQPLHRGRADLVLGSRLRGTRQPGAMPPQSVWGNRLACFLMRLVWGARYSDLGPFRAIGYDQLWRLRMRDRNFGWTIEMQIKAHRQGLRVIEVAVPYRRRVGVSKISGTLSGTLRAGYKILWTIASQAWRSWRKR